MDTVITRSRWVLGFFIFALSLCAVRLVQLQIIEGPSLAAQGQRVRTSSTEVAAARGTITDATGVVLANSIQTYDIAVNQVNIAPMCIAMTMVTRSGEAPLRPLVSSLRSSA